MPFDIEYLLLLQNFRQSINDALTPFLENLSLFAVTYLILIPVFIYWVIDKRKGYYIIGSYALVCAVNSLVKLCVCAYRPWIRDARVVPAGDAITTATGYSFPSGHSAVAGTLYGGMGVTNYKKKRWLSWICVVLLLLTGFSRNYLGVHTPQDVFVGISLSVLALIIMKKVFEYLDAHPEKENVILILTVLFAIQSLIFITFKPYPMEYVDGKLLVDPQRMMNDGYGDTARLIVFCIARYIERRWIKFESTGFNTKGIITALVGLVFLGLMIKFLGAPLDAALGSHWGHFVKDSIMMFYMMAAYPAIIKLICNTKKETE